jgi:alcohol dehydrogenase (cytochrome c)
MPNRGVAVLGQTVFVAASDSFLIALDANTGKQRWIVKVADHRDGYTMTGAPLALGDRVVVGVAGGELGIRGFLVAFDAAEGRQLWKFHTVPGPGEAGHDTWAGDAWKTGGAPTWTVGAYDPQEDLIFWGTGNPGPVYQASGRPGDNLFSNSVVAIEAKTGRLRWFYQFTPADEHDWDSVQQPILAEIDWQGRKRAVVLWANRNAFFYALDRKTGEFLFAKPFVKQTWNLGFDAKGRPRMAGSARPSASGALVWPAVMAATNWWPPSYDASRQLVFVPCSDAAGIYYQSEQVKYDRGERFEGSAASYFAQNLPATAYVKAIDARTGDVRWQTVLDSGSENFVWTVGGVLSTKGGIVFAGYRDFFRAFDADTGKELWKINLGARVRGSPISFSLDGKQYIAVAAGHSMFVFLLPGP